jgi:hypothetical protein
MHKFSKHARESELRSIAGPAGDLFPRILVHLIDILIDRKNFAARRAAEGDFFSADTELDCFAADSALHKNLVSTTEPRRHGKKLTYPAVKEQSFTLFELLSAEVKSF